MLPGKVFEILHAVMAILVLFQHFSGKLCLNFLTLNLRGKSGYMERLSSQENWLVVKRQLFAAMMRPTSHIIHNKSDDPNFSTLVTRKGFVRPISPDKFSLRRVIRTTHDWVL